MVHFIWIGLFQMLKHAEKYNEGDKKNDKFNSEWAKQYTYFIYNLMNIIV